MIILSVHNSYQQPGGEDEVYRQEAQLLEERKHVVIRLNAHNNDVIGKSSLELLTKTVFNREAYACVRSLIQKTKPDIVHVHNTFPLLSPSVYYAARKEHLPVVQTLHNYRLLCPAAVLYREGRICEKCIQSVAPWPAVRYGCYRGRPASAAAATMLTFHRLLKTFKNYVSTYVALSEFARLKFIEGGIPADKLMVKPNFVEPDPGEGDGSENFCMFVGRLTGEKGVRTLLDAWTRFGLPFDLEIAGDGELAPAVIEAVRGHSNIRWLGRLNKEQLYQRMKKARALIIPSTWYEPFGLVVAEAFAMGLPVIASRIGALSALVAHGRTGLHFESGNAADLAEKVIWTHSHPDALLAMRKEARMEFLNLYSADRNYSMLMNIYRKTLDAFGTGPALEEESELRETKPTQTLIQTAG